MDLENFLIENSDVNKEFIKDFFGFQKINEFINYKPFTISLDNIAFWLEMRKSKLKQNLIENYSKNIDYIINKTLLHPKVQQEASHGGHNKKLILLTPDCFKMLCMRSRTAKAEKVRQYYIDLEKLIDSYKDTIINNQIRKIKLLENDMKNEKYPKGGHCYIFEEKDELEEIYYRIGQSCNMTKRMANHNSSNSHKKVVIYKIKTDNISHYESCLRGVMFDFRYTNNKDYYKIPLEKLNDAVKNCKNITIKFKNDKKYDQTGGGIDIRKIDEKITKMFSRMSENIRWNFYRKPQDAYYNGKKITEKKLNDVALPSTYFRKKIIVPVPDQAKLGPLASQQVEKVHRFSEYIEIIYLDECKITYKQLFNTIHKFYNEKINLKQLQQIPNDVDDYVKDAIIKAKTGKIVYKKDLIGSLNRFEGLYEIKESLYLLRVGS